MVKKIQKSSKRVETPFKAYYKVIGRACGCSSKYAKLVLLGMPLGKYNGKTYTDRDTPLTRRIKAKAEELESFLNPQPTTK
jgi:hypothetical protein